MDPAPGHESVAEPEREPDGKAPATGAAAWLGRLSYEPPSWLKELRRRRSEAPGLQEEFRAAYARSEKWFRENRVQAIGLATISALTIILTIGVRSWYRNRPKLTSLTPEASSPPATPLKEGSKPEPVLVEFGGSAARLADIGKALSSGVALEPPFPGQWVWSSDHELKFTPAEDWPVGQEFRVRFERALFPEHVRLSTREARFRTAPFSGRIESAEFYQDPRDPKLKKLVATLSFSHPVDPTSLEERIFIGTEGQGEGLLGFAAKSFPFSVTYDERKGEAYIHSAPIQIPEKDARMSVRVADGVRSERGGPADASTLNGEIVVPGMYTFFRVQSIETTLARNERYEPEQVLVLNMTAGVHEREILPRLEAYALPRSFPPRPGRPPVRFYGWHDPSWIGPEVLAASEKLELEALPTEHEHATTHGFRYRAEPGRPIYVRLSKGARAWGDYLLHQDQDAIVRVPQFPRELNIMSEGSLLSLSGEKKLSVVSRGIPAIRFELSRVLPGQINHLVSQTEGRFQNPEFRNWNFDAGNISERFVEIKTLPGPDPRRSQYTALDLGPYLSGSGEPRGLFFLSVQSWDPERQVATDASDRRMVLVTDLGLLVKELQDGGRSVFVQSISDGRPVPGVRVELIGKNGIAVGTKATDERGRADFPDLSGLSHEKTPTAFLARLGSDLSFIPYDWGDRRLELSRFDVGGKVTAAEPGTLEAYLFSDRGIYRPGDEIRVGAIVKRPGWGGGLEGVPLEAVVTDPRGLVVRRERLRLSAAGFEELRFAPEENAPTGGYEFSLFVVKDEHRRSLLGSTRVRVEEFLPDRMKIATRFSDERKTGWARPKGLSASVELKNLFGTPAADRRVAAEITLSPALPDFAAYPGFVFFDPNDGKTRFNERLEDAQSDGNGAASFALSLERFTGAVYRLEFLAQGYESGGGRSVSSESSLLVSDLPQLLGYKPDGDLSYVSRRSERSLKVIALGPELTPLGATDLALHIEERRFVSALKRQPDGTHKYQSVEKRLFLSSAACSIPAAGLVVPLPTAEPGDFELSLRDAGGAALLKAPYSVVGEANLTRSLEKTAELQVRLAKPDYAPGEELELSIVAPYGGSGLITIERDRVYAQKWFKTEKTSTVERIRLPEEIEGNAYVNVTFIRAADSPEIFMSPLSAAVAPFTISRARRVNGLELEIPEKGLPGEPYKIRYKSGSPGKIVVFAVDEGILQVAGYRTPDPLSKFFEKRALEVRTLQILDLILPEFALVRKLSSPGGDGYDAIGKNLNPFKRKRDKPLAFWSGILDAGTDWGELKFILPEQFNGSVRVMAVSVSPEAIGVAEKRGLVRGPFVLTPSAPTFAGPGDSFELPVGVHNNAEGSGPKAQVSVSLETSEHLAVLGDPKAVLDIPEGREGLARFKVKAKGPLGSGSLRLRASWGKLESRQTVELSLRPPTPYLAQVRGGHLSPENVLTSITPSRATKRPRPPASIELPTARRMHPHYRKLEAMVSTVPLGLARGLAAYLDNYPYPCTEQLVSRSFPALALVRHKEFGYAPSGVERTLDRAFQILRSRQNDEGGFGFWAANSHVSPFQTVYAAHFLTEARENGRAVPFDVLQKSLLYLHGLGTRSPEALDDARNRAYALYVLTRNGQVRVNEVQSLLQWLKANAKGRWEKDLTGAYLAATFRMMKVEDRAEDLIAELTLGEPQENDYEHFYDGLRRDAQLLYLLAKHFPERLKKLTGDDLLAVAQPVSDGSFNTTTAAYAILAFDAYAAAVGAPRAGAFTVQELRGGKANALSFPEGLMPSAAFSPETEALRIKNRAPEPLFYQLTQAGFDLNPPTQEIKDGLEIFREYLDDGGSPATKVAVGAELTVRLRLRSLSGGVLSHAAVVDLLPGGFEVVNDPADAPSDNVRIAAPGSSWVPDYADVREDRVVLFGSVAQEAQEFRYRVRAVGAGSYSVPPAFGESMYDRRVQARALGGQIRVEPR